MNLKASESEETQIAGQPLEPRVNIESRADGILILTSPYMPGELPRSMAHLLLERAADYPARTLIAEKDEAGNWRHLTYADAVAGAKSVAQWLLDQGANESKPLAILSGSSIQHFLMAWGAIFAKVPYVPVSTSYSTVRGAFPKLEAVLKRVDPSFIFTEDIDVEAEALLSIDLSLDSRCLISNSSLENYPCVKSDSIFSVAATDAVDDSIESITNDTVMRYMFTSGSTGMPKGVIHTQGMACQFIASTSTTKLANTGAIETLSLIHI